jgi:polyphosphate kinase
VQRIFHFLSGDDEAPTFRHLMVAPFDLRERLTGLIRAEAERAGRGEEAGITFKLNALEDEGVILDLYRAAQAGASIRGVVRGICRMVPGAPGWSERVELLSVVDRYLEHGRVYAFHNGGEPLVFLASADWMHRNLSRRVEVAFPVRDPTLRAQVLDGLRLQLEDTRKARVLDGRGLNRYARGGGPPLRSQQTIREQLLALAPTSLATP